MLGHNHFWPPWHGMGAGLGRAQVQPAPGGLLASSELPFHPKLSPTAPGLF